MESAMNSSPSSILPKRYLQPITPALSNNPRPGIIIPDCIHRYLFTTEVSIEGISLTMSEMNGLRAQILGKHLIPIVPPHRSPSTFLFSYFCQSHQL